MYKLGSKSAINLLEVNPLLQTVIKRAIQVTEQDFSVLEGLRTATRQMRLYEKKASKFNGIKKSEGGTGLSRHQTGEAVDLGAYIDGHIAWDWPLYIEIAKAVRSVAIELSISVVWGGVWDTPLNQISGDLEEEMARYAQRRYELGKKPFHDGPHFQLGRGRRAK